VHEPCFSDEQAPLTALLETNVTKSHEKRWYFWHHLMNLAAHLSWDNENLPTAGQGGVVKASRLEYNENCAVFGILTAQQTRDYCKITIYRQVYGIEWMKITIKASTSH
jgi:hypothetical protein